MNDNTAGTEDCTLYSAIMLTCTAASGSTEADNAVLDDNTAG